MKFFASSFNTILATLIIGTTSVAASTVAEVQHDTIEVCRHANSLNSQLLVYQRTESLDALQDTVQACLNLNSVLETLTSDAKNLVPQRMSVVDTASVCGTLEACAPTFQSIFDLSVALPPASGAAFPEFLLNLLFDTILPKVLSDVEAELSRHSDRSAFPCYSNVVRTVDSSKLKYALGYPDESFGDEQ